MACLRANVACHDHVREQFNLLYTNTGFVVGNTALQFIVYVEQYLLRSRRNGLPGKRL